MTLHEHVRAGAHRTEERHRQLGYSGTLVAPFGVCALFFVSRVYRLHHFLHLLCSAIYLSYDWLIWSQASRALPHMWTNCLPVPVLVPWSTRPAKERSLKWLHPPRKTPTCCESESDASPTRDAMQGSGRFASCPCLARRTPSQSGSQCAF